MFVAEGKVEICLGLEGAENVELEGKTTANRDYILPGKVHFSPSSRPVFSKRKERSKTFFSSSIFSIVKSPFPMVPASGESPASVINAERVCHGFQL